MSKYITLKTNVHAYKGSDGQFHTYDTVSDGTTAERIAAINQAAQEKIEAIEQLQTNLDYVTDDDIEAMFNETYEGGDGV